MRTSSGTKFVRAAVVVAAAILAHVCSDRACCFISAVKGRRSVSFVVSTNNLQHAHHKHSMTSSKILSSSALNSKFDGGNEDIFLLSIDGTLASSTTSKSWMAVCAALKVWPALHSTFETLGMNPDAFDCTHNSIELDGSCEWLIQKLSALASISQHGNSPDAMLGCDAVLLSRLLLEEQLLDGGRSNGRGGKYGGKFHPSTSDDDVDTGERSNVGSRPLTVGELCK